jgi:hypothetical protein
MTATRPAPRAPRPRRPARPASLRRPAGPAVSDQPRVYWPVIGAVAGLCVVLIVGLVVALREIRSPASAATPVAAVPAPAELPRPDVRMVAPEPLPPDDPPPQPAPKPAPATPAPQPAPPADDPVAALTRPPDTGAICPAQPAADGATCPAGGRYGTAVDFVDDPTKAGEQALKDGKLLFVIHIAGNFEDSKFT